MPAALTLEEKKVKAEARLEAKQEPVVAVDQPQSAFNGTVGKLAVDFNIPGYHGYIFNDTPGRIQNALNSGYEFVTPDEVGGIGENVVSRNTDIGDKVRFLVGVDNGQPLYGYLMKIKQEWWDNNQKALQRRNNMIDEAIRNPTPQGGEKGKFYDGGTKMDT